MRPASQFQSTRPRGARRTTRQSALIPFYSFNPRARVGRDRCPRTQRGVRRSFNPRARVGRDVIVTQAPGLLHKFQSTRPRGARRSWLRTRQAGSSRFNPRARVGRDQRAVWVAHRPHSFNPRARVGRDVGFLPGAVATAGFQSTRPRGARRQDEIIGKIITYVSIHAPAWGATPSWLQSARRYRCFNPRARVGRDNWRADRGTSGRSFNPRARVGRDPSTPGRIAINVHRVSIHAPAWGATKGLTCTSSPRGPVFQSTRPRGARR